MAIKGKTVVLIFDDELIGNYAYTQQAYKGLVTAMSKARVDSTILGQPSALPSAQPKNYGGAPIAYGHYVTNTNFPNYLAVVVPNTNNSTNYVELVTIREVDGSSPGCCSTMEFATYQDFSSCGLTVSPLPFHASITDAEELGDPLTPRIDFLALANHLRTDYDCYGVPRMSIPSQAAPPTHASHTYSKTYQLPTYMPEPKMPEPWTEPTLAPQCHDDTDYSGDDIMRITKELFGG